MCVYKLVVANYRSDNAHVIQLHGPSPYLQAHGKALINKQTRKP